MAEPVGVDEDGTVVVEERVTFHPVAVPLAESMLAEHGENAQLVMLCAMWCELRSIGTVLAHGQEQAEQAMAGMTSGLLGRFLRGPSADGE